MLVIILLGCIIYLWPGELVATATVAPPAPQNHSVTPPLPYFPLPAEITLCGDKLPLADREVREDLDREFTIAVWSRAQTTLWIKRAARYFPHIEKKLREARLPDDLKYVALIESDLRPQVKSPAGAAGVWQFMKPTANRFLLKTESPIDERMDFILATDAALQYLVILHRQFKQWPLALAAYNCGEGRVQQAIKEQGVDSYFKLSLPEETERYVPRLVAAKIIVSNPERYGYAVPQEELYVPLAFDQIEFTLSKEITLRRVAEACGSHFKALKRLNPQLQTTKLRPGVYRLNVPSGCASRFYEVYMQGQLNTP